MLGLPCPHPRAGASSLLRLLRRQGREKGWKGGREQRRRGEPHRRRAEKAARAVTGITVTVSVFCCCLTNDHERGGFTPAFVTSQFRCVRGTPRHSGFPAQDLAWLRRRGRRGCTWSEAGLEEDSPLSTPTFRAELVSHLPNSQPLVSLRSESHKVSELSLKGSPRIKSGRPG